MKYALWGIGFLLGLALLYGVLQIAASERVEVVQLHTTDEAGEPQVTRLWVVDDENYQYLRVGADGSGWFSRIEATGEFKVTRADVTVTYTAVLRKDKSELVNTLMLDKYTWGDEFISWMVGGRQGAIPIELHPVNRQ